MFIIFEYYYHILREKTSSLKCSDLVAWQRNTFIASRTVREQHPALAHKALSEFNFRTEC